MAVLTMVEVRVSVVAIRRARQMPVRPVLGNRPVVWGGECARTAEHQHQVHEQRKKDHIPSLVLEQN